MFNLQFNYKINKTLILKKIKNSYNLIILLSVFIFFIVLFIYLNNKNKNKSNFASSSTPKPTLLLKSQLLSTPKPTKPTKITKQNVPKYTDLGCYKDKTKDIDPRAAPHAYNREHRAIGTFIGDVKTIDECYQLAKTENIKNKNYNLFALQGGGQCFLGNTADSISQNGLKSGLKSPRYSMYGKDNNCPKLGGNWLNHVFSIIEQSVAVRTNDNIYGEGNSPPEMGYAEGCSATTSVVDFCKDYDNCCVASNLNSKCFCNVPIVKSCNTKHQKCITDASNKSNNSSLIEKCNTDRSTCCDKYSETIINSSSFEDSVKNDQKDNILCSLFSIRDITQKCLELCQVTPECKAYSASNLTCNLFNDISPPNVKIDPSTGKPIINNTVDFYKKK